MTPELNMLLWVGIFTASWMSCVWLRIRVLNRREKKPHASTDTRTP